MTDTEDRSRADLTRARLLGAAVVAFAERGFRGSTTRDITSIAEVSTIDVCHRSKEELLYQISRSGHLDSLERIRATALLSLGIDIARWYHEGGSWSPKDIGDHYADLALRIVGSRRSSPPGPARS
ncbi:hypothetical protein [Nocardia sp. CA-119907]|uniref:hypothetical protein n=1 Tax=Nocardia sp. CA-119907 TaxID=3239973 RepID=UPI003D997CD2